MKIKLITGFTDEQKYIIDAEESHKAYYLFLNPDKRGVFKNGLALVGKNIQAIQPAWQETMGWNGTHKLDDDDWNHIRGKGVDTKMNQFMEEGKKAAYTITKGDITLLEKKLSDIYPKLNERN